jgi:hypothetical protein
MGFAYDVLKFQAKALAQANKSVCDAFEYVTTQEVVLSPDNPTRTGEFVTGLLKNSFYPQVGGGYDMTVGTTANLSGTDSLSRIKAAVATQPFLGKDNTITLTNSVPEAYRADVLGWPMGQGANGWIWSGKVTAYGFTSQAINNFKGAYS